MGRRPSWYFLIYAAARTQAGARGAGAGARIGGPCIDVVENIHDVQRKRGAQWHARNGDLKRLEYAGRLRMVPRTGGRR